MTAPTAPFVDTDELIDAEQANRYRAEGWWRDRTYLDDFDDAVVAAPDKVAIVTHRSEAPDDPVVLSYRQLDRHVRRFAAALVGLGVGPGQVVSVQLPNTWIFAALSLACGRIGAVVNPLVPIFRERELTFILGRTESPVVIVPSVFRGFDHAAMLDRVLVDLPAGTRGFAVGIEEPVGAVAPFEAHFVARRWEDEVDPARLERDRLAPDAVAELQFTSGTTGEPKGVMHTPNTIYAGTRAFSETVGLTASDSIIMPSTLAHQTGFLVGIILPLAAGMKVVYQDVWDAEVFCRLVDDEAITFSAGATPFLTDIVAACQRRGRRLASMRSYLCAGAPIPSPLVQATQDDAVDVLIALWGMTENGGVTLTRPGDPVELVADSDGTPVGWMEVRVVDDAGAEVPVGGVGRLLVRGASQTIGYFKRPDLYRAQLSAADDGGAAWFDTGDLARRRPDGGIRIAGRTKDLVIRGGENVPVVEVEAVLFGHPKVREVAVIGYPDERLGERACAVVVADAGSDGLELAELTAWLDGAGMAKQFWPERLELVEAMPKTPSGKIQKFALRERFS
ncbi:MAG: AMP-binding protein [Acidimicrobiales bacterium]|nr:AMP-binding protein [Acidimicrobiales bacterium]